MAEIAEVHTTERCVIPAIREAYIQPFTAPNWLDLRVGFFLSVTGATDDDNTEQALMEEPITNAAGLRSSDRYWIGLKTDGTILPRREGVTFMGYTNSQHGQLAGDDPVELRGDSLMSIAATNYWLPYNSENIQWSAGVFVGRTWRAANVTNQQQIFPKTAATVAAGYATLFALRFTRTSADSRTITMSCKRDADEGSNILFSNTPDTATIETALGDFPDDVGNYGPFQVPDGQIPDALYFYWPFYHSRLRIHSIGVLKYR